MQHPVGHRVAEDGTLRLSSFWAFVLNPWAFVQYAHNMMASVMTASFVVAALGAFYVLEGRHLPQARLFLKIGTVAGLISSLLVAFPTGDQQAKLVARHQPAALAGDGGALRERPAGRART